MANEAAVEEDEDEFSFEGFDEYLDGFDEDAFEESDEKEKMLAVDPDFASCGTKWLDKDDSCHHCVPTSEVSTRRSARNAFKNSIGCSI